MFYGCTTYGWNREWCSLTDSYDRDGQWGNCLEGNLIHETGPRGRS